MREQTDVIVLGMGIAGELIASGVAEAGLDVVGIDRELVGGECPYWGCIPSKMMIRAANLLAEARRIPGIAGQVTVVPDWDTVAARIRDEATDDWDDRVAVERYERKGGRFVRGNGTFVRPNQVEVAGEIFEATRGVVIATGTAPSIPPIPGLEHVGYWTNRDAIAAKELPESLIVLGAGAIGMELAQVFGRFGVRVAVVEAADRVMPLEEPEVGALLAEVLRREGIAVHTSAKVTSVRADAERITIVIDGAQELVADQLLIAAGRRADLARIAADKAGIDERQPWIPVDGRLRVADGLWAVGDVTGVGPFTHVAVHQARVALDDILGRDPSPADTNVIPRVTFTDPEVASVGSSEAEARAAARSVRVGYADVASSARGWLHKAGNEEFVKLVEDESRGVLVGATAVGPSGGEVLSMLTLAIDAAIPTRDLRRMIYAYPTFHRTVEDALANLAP
jgi:pyruvate/2-oxoglutarate dehydrogenase complex dihydrolipoamide dehydrogenase (E3) component